MPDMPQVSKLVRERHRPWPLNVRLLAARRMRRVAPVVAIILAIGALSASAIPDPADAQASRAAASAAGRVLIGQADLHVDTVAGDDELEVDLSISQTRSACQAPLNGQICLRYSILLDDRPVHSGYGLIPLSDVEIAASTITLRTDTCHEPHVICTSGVGGAIALTWSTSTAFPRPIRGASALTAATVRGSIVGYIIPQANVTAGILLYGSP